MPVISGVPQGSRLGPLLFLIYFNDVVHSVQNSNVKLFAEECKLFFATESPYSFDSLKEDLSNNVLDWAKKSQLNIAWEKKFGSASWFAKSMYYLWNW